MIPPFPNVILVKNIYMYVDFAQYLALLNHYQEKLTACFLSPVRANVPTPPLQAGSYRVISFILQ